MSPNKNPQNTETDTIEALDATTAAANMDKAANVVNATEITPVPPKTPHSGSGIQPVGAQTADPRPLKDATKSTTKPKAPEPEPIAPDECYITVASSPHINNQGISTRRIMLDVIISMLPLVVASIIFFKQYAIMQLAFSIASCLVAELIFTSLMRRKGVTLGDLSAIVTALVLALSMPATAPWYVTVIAGFAAIGIGKAVFGGLGMNIFNPAMVGRAFVMIAFAGAMAASGYVDLSSQVDIITQATPLTAFKQNAQSINLYALLIGNANGSLGETSAIACVIGGLYLCVRKVINWEVPTGVIVAVTVIAAVNALVSSNSAVALFSVTSWSILHQLLGGAVLFGAFFIATDPVTSPFTTKGKWIFGLGVGFFIMVLRLFSGYPEGVMFAVLIMNALTPLINRWTIPKPFGGFLKQEKKGA